MIDEESALHARLKGNVWKGRHLPSWLRLSEAATQDCLQFFDYGLHM